MRIAKNIFLVLGIILILFNLLAFLGGASPFVKNPSATTEERVGYFVGTFLVLFIGLLFLWISYRINKRIKRRQDKELLDSFLSK
jgi:hypothetical protein